MTKGLYEICCLLEQWLGRVEYPQACRKAHDAESWATAAPFSQHISFRAPERSLSTSSRRTYFIVIPFIPLLRTTLTV